MALPSYEVRQDWAAFCRHSYFWKDSEQVRWVLWLNDNREVVRIYGAPREFKSQLPMPLEQVEKRIPPEVSWAALDMGDFAKTLESSVLGGPGQANVNWMEALSHLKARTKTVSGELSAGSIQAFEKHFLVRAMQAWQAWFLPKKFAVVIDLKSVAPKNGSKRGGLKDEHSLVLVFQNRKLEAYFAENSLGLVVDSSGDSEVRTRAIKERLGIPVQYVSLHELDWVDLLASADPWDGIVKAVAEHRVRFYPATTRLMAWIYAMRAWGRFRKG